jgi:hypothetical protein
MKIRRKLSRKFENFFTDLELLCDLCAKILFQFFLITTNKNNGMGATRRPFYMHGSIHPGIGPTRGEYSGGR